MIERYANVIKLDALKSRFILIILFISLILLKNGFDIYGDSHIKESADLFPIPYDGTSSSYLPVLIYKYLNMNLPTWLLLNVLMIVLLILSIGISVYRNYAFSKYLIVLTLFINSPSITTLLQQLGHYQTFYIIFSILFTTVKSKSLHYFFGVFMVVSSPEYSFISLLLLYY